MEAQEFMLGDWVKVNGMQRQITRIGQDTVYFSNTYYPIDVLKPIKLTKKILKKNGFKEPEYSLDDELVFEIAHGAFIDAEVRVSPDEEERNTWVAGIVSDTSSLQILFDYVHELQHAIKLCGIDKKIRL